MQKANIEVLRKILYAVESGGQVYGCQNYAAFIGAGANCSNEKAITIGAGQWYAGEAQKLLQKIQRANPAQFKKMDTQGLESDLLKKNWATYAISPTSAKAKCIVTIINSALGHKCQDELMDEQITEYAASIAKTYGTMPDTAMMECINIIHQGGSAALKRILAKTAKPYTAKSIYAALNTDTSDPRTNQVGDYTTRQKKVYEFITKYASDGATGAVTKTETTTEIKKEGAVVSTVQQRINKAINWMEETAKDDRHGYCQDHRWGEDGDYDCSSAVITAWEQAGVPVKSKGATYTGNMLSVFKANGFTDVTAKVNRSTGAGLVRGDVLLNTVHHTAMYCGNGKEVEASINEKGTAHGGKPGDQTGKEFLIRSYRNYPWTNVLRYTGGNSTSVATKNYLEIGDSGSAVKTMQLMLIECGYSCGSSGADGEFGSGTDAALRKFQKDNSLVVDGQYGPASKAKLTAIHNAKAGGNSAGNGKNPSTTPKWVGMVNTAELNVRTGAGTGNPKLATYPLLKQRNLVDVCDTVRVADGTDWYYVRIAGKYFGYVCAKYISKV